jgi:NAD(P)-dependent dehydrogenase (short-subunit alcohol dehydrogenase family)
VTKAAIQSFARFWTVDLKHREICVNAIRPGSIDSPGINHLFENGQQVQEMKKTLLNTIPMGRDGNPNASAAPAASDDSSFTTGIELFVDGARGQI